MKRILLTAEEAAIASSESSAGTENLDAFLDTLEKMEPSEIITKYGEKVLLALITVVVGAILVRWVLKIIMRHVEKSELAAGATKFIHGIVAFLLYFIVILTAVGPQAAAAILDAIFGILKFTATLVSQCIQRAVTENTAKGFGVRPFVTGEIFTLLMLKKIVMAHDFSSLPVGFFRFLWYTHGRGE